MSKNIYLFLLNIIVASIMFSISATAQDIQPVAARDYNIPQEVRGIVIQPGVDFALQKNQLDLEVKAEIDNILKQAKTFQINTIYLNINHSDGVIYPSKYLPCYTSFDAMEYFLEQGSKYDIYVYAIINPTYFFKGDLLHTKGYITPDVILNSQNNLKEFLISYSPNAVLIDGYYNSVSEKSFAAYKLFASGIGFEEWLFESSTALIKALSDIVFEVNPDVQFGLLCDSVWANTSTIDSGSKTSSDIEMLTYGYINLPAILKAADIKTVLIKLPGAISDTVIPFTSTLSWWNDQMSEEGADVVAVVYNNKLLEDYEGWDSPDQVLRQIIASREINSKGVAFSSFYDLVNNKENHTDLIVRFYKDQVNTTDILTQLVVSKPEKLEYSTDESSASFYGASDPNFPLLINGNEVKRNEKGIFSLSEDLAAGENIFVINHKNSTVTYKINGNTKIIQNISPVGGLTVEGGTLIPINVYAYKNSIVTATIGERKITLLPREHGDDTTDRSSSYILYSANFECPQSFQGSQSIGNINITATWQGITHTSTGANVTVTSKPSSIAVGQNGSLIEVTATQARTYSASFLNSEISGNSFPIPKGSRDFIVSDLLTYNTNGETNSYYILRSGVRVNASDITVIGESTITQNNISQAKIFTDNSFTYLQILQEQPFAYNMTIPNLGFDNNSGISNFNAKSISIAFDEVNNIPNEIGFTKNNIFSSATITKNNNQAIITLNLNKAGKFAGYTSYYENGYLTFKFTSMPPSLSGAKIYLDPGHGGIDSGALPITGLKSEAMLNYEMAAKVSSILKSRGAEVEITDCANTTVSLDTRINLAKKFSPHLFVSIHHNSSISPLASGTEAWYFSPYSKPYADTVSSFVASALDTKNRGGKYGLYRVTSSMEFPSILLETGFLSNISEYDKLKNQGYQNAVALSIANAIENVFKK